MESVACSDEDGKCSGEEVEFEGLSLFFSQWLTSMVDMEGR